MLSVENISTQGTRLVNVLQWTHIKMRR